MNTINSAIKMLRDAEFSDDEIRARLSGAGFTPYEIDEEFRIADVMGSIDKGGTKLPPPPPTDESEFTPGQRRAITATRYGPAVLTAPAGPFVGAGMVAGGEFAARQLEDYFRDPDTFNELEKKKSQLVGGLTAGGLDLAFYGLLSGLGQAYKRVSRKFSTASPQSFDPQDIDTASRVLADITATKGGKPYVLSLGQQGKYNNGFLNFLEATGRSAMFGKREFAKFDKRNLDAIYEMVDDYIQTQVTRQSPKETGDFLNQLLNGVRGGVRKGDAFRPVDALKTQLYKRVNYLATTAPPIDGSAIPTYLTDRPKSVKVKEVWSKLSKKVIDETGDVIQLLPDIDDAQAWRNLDWETADNAIKRINELYGKVVEEEKIILTGIKKRLQPEFDKSLKAVPGLKDAYDTATAFHSGASETLFKNKIIKKVRETLEAKPSTVVSMFTNHADRYDKMLELKKAISFSTAVEGGASRYNKWWDENVVKPIRHHLLSETVDTETGLIVGSKLSKMLDKVTKNGTSPEYAKEIFGGVDYKNLRDAATAMNVVENSAFGDKVFIQLVQGGALFTTLGAAGAAISGNEVAKDVGIGTAVIFLTPYALSRVMASPRLVNLISNSMKHGKNSRYFKNLIRHVIAIQAAERAELGEKSIDAVNFYSNMLSPEQQPQLNEGDDTLDQR